MKLTSSRWVNRILVALITLTVLFFALQLVDHFISRKFTADETRQREERTHRFEPKERWIRVQPRQGAFSVLMPNRPTLLTNIVNPPTGKLDRRQWISIDYVNRVEKNSYVVGFTEFPTNVTLNDRELTYDRAHAEISLTMGQLLEERPVMLQGVSGRESRVMLRDGTNMSVMRAFFVDQRFYQVTAIVPISHGTTTNTWRFLDSFRFITNSPTE